MEYLGDLPTRHIGPAAQAMAKLGLDALRRPFDEAIDTFPHAEPLSADWQERGACRQADAEAFFPEKGETNPTAKRVCEGCQVRPQCLAHALENQEIGIWGGTSENERKKMQRQRGSLYGNK